MINKENLSNNKANQKEFPFILPTLPYDKKELEPYISAETLNYHHGKHHQTYVNNLNKLLETDHDTDVDLENIIFTSYEKQQNAIFNNAAQIWNHSFYWNCLCKDGGGSPKNNLLQQINQDFGDYNSFIKEFKQAATTQFGSGWAWLVFDYHENKLKVVKTSNAVTPIINNQLALLTCDVWEHAYYLDYQNKRPEYVDVFLERLVNWNFVEENFEKAVK